MSRPSINASITVNNIHIEQFDLVLLVEEQKNDLELQNLAKDKHNFVEVPYCNAKLICENSTGRYSPFVPKSKRMIAFQQLHSIGHPGKKEFREASQ